MPMVVKDEVLSRLTAQEVYGDCLERAGKRLRRTCPFHEEKKASFMVDPASLAFRCFGCGKSGSAFDYVMMAEGVDFRAALEILAERARVDVAGGNGKYSNLYAVNKEALSFYERSLRENRKVLEHLTSERGLAGESIRRFHIGCSDGASAVNALLGNGFSEEDLVSAGIAVRKGGHVRDFFTGRIMFPVVSGGRVMGFGGRLISGEGPKYMNTPSTPVFRKREILYGLDPLSIKEKGFALVVEGYLDVVMCHQHGYRNAVAPLGTVLTREHVDLLGKYCDNVVLVFDGDGAGERAAERSVKLLFERRTRGYVAVMSEGYDPDTFLRAGKSLDELIEKAVPLSVYLVKRFPETRKPVFNALLRRGRAEIAEFLAHMGSPEEKGAFFEISARYAVEHMLKGAPVVASRNDLSVKRHDDCLYIFSGRRFLFWNAIRGDVAGQAGEMIDLIFKLRRRISG